MYDNKAQALLFCFIKIMVMISICKLIEVMLDEIPDNQYEHIKNKCVYYYRVWDINRVLLDSSTVYGDLFGFNSFINVVR